MDEYSVERASTTEGLPVSSAMTEVLESAAVPKRMMVVDQRVVFISLVSVLIGIGVAFIAMGLVALIGLITNIAFYGRFSFVWVSPAGNHLGAWVIVIPVIGGVIVGLMARYGSAAIRGHGIPEAMEHVLTKQSRIPPGITFWKPLSSAIAIGTGGPFGAEGPIIATGGALGSLVGQVLSTTAGERKTLLAAGAAAGMAAIFGSPASAVLLAIELLLFEFRPRSLIPVALASTAAMGVRIAGWGLEPIFPMGALSVPTGLAIVCYILVGAIVGVASVGVTWLVYAIEDLFELLPVHWMWWPAIGAVAVGVVGYFAPRTLGVGYDVITGIVSNHIGPLSVIVVLGVMKLVSWSIALGSGTSGGTLAPLFTIGSALGAILGVAMGAVLPHVGIDIRVAALVGMAAMFAGASRALLASTVFAFETTLQPLGLLPLLGGCSAAFLVASLLGQHGIMTKKIARRGIRVPAEYAADFLDLIPVSEVAATNVTSLGADETLESVRKWIASGAPGSQHQGFPVEDEQGHLVGVVTRRDLLDEKVPGSKRVRELLKRPPIVTYDDSTLRDAADHMVNHDVGRLPVISRETGKIVGMITRSDVLSAHRRRLRETHEPERIIRLRRFFGAGRRAESGERVDGTLKG
ncbi:MAG: chloride channel protein [Bacillota bacterium]